MWFSSMITIKLAAPNIGSNEHQRWHSDECLVFWGCIYFTEYESL